MSQFKYDEGSYKFNSSTKTWSRSFSWTSDDKTIGARVTQKVQIDSTGKNYIITNDLSSIGTKPILFEFMLHMDTAYAGNEDDAYYTDDRKELNNFCIFNTAKSENQLFQQWLDTDMSSYIYDVSKYPDSISITNHNPGDWEENLPYTEKMSFSGKKPVISFGYWSVSSGMAQWDYYNDIGAGVFDGMLGDDAYNGDRAVSLIWSTGASKNDLLAAGQKPYSFSFKFGVEDKDLDGNIPSGRIKQTIDEPIIKDINPKSLRIQAGASSAGADGIFIHLANATAEALGVADIDFLTQDSSRQAINYIKVAIDRASKFRSYFGAVQNRMEHTIANLDNVVENTQSAESRIRDTDMAEEMINHAKNNILLQAGQSVLAQANQNSSGILSLLQ